jgi:hypothetical protein
MTSGRGKEINIEIQTFNKIKNMTKMMDVAGLIGITLLVSIPIVAIVCETIVRIRRKNKEMELRKAIIESHMDSESIKLLIDNTGKKSNKFVMLRWGGILLGAGVGAAVSSLIGIETARIYFWFSVIIGMGCGMLSAFIVEYRLSQSKSQGSGKEPSDNPS